MDEPWYMIMVLSTNMIVIRHANVHRRGKEYDCIIQDNHNQLAIFG